MDGWMDRRMDEATHAHARIHTRAEGSVSVAQLQHQSLICFVVKAVLFLIRVVMEMLRCHTALEVLFCKKKKIIHFTALIFNIRPAHKPLLILDSQHQILALCSCSFQTFKDDIISIHQSPCHEMLKSLHIYLLFVIKSLKIHFSSLIQ